MKKKMRMGKNNTTFGKKQKNNTPSTCKTANRLSECTLESHCRRRRGESVPHITVQDLNEFAMTSCTSGPVPSSISFEAGYLPESEGSTEAVLSFPPTRDR